MFVFIQVWQGLDVVKTARKMLGETNPADSLPGTIRGDYCVEVGRLVFEEIPNFMLNLLKRSIRKLIRSKRFSLYRFLVFFLDWTELHEYIYNCIYMNAC